jgi:site-specific recombinase XerD
MNLSMAIDSYITLKRSLGAVFRAETRILSCFLREFGNIPLDTLCPAACRTFCRGAGPPTRWWERKYYTLRDFFAFWLARGHLAVSPLPDAGPKVPRSFEPYIYSRAELQRLLDATSLLEDKSSAPSPQTLRALLLVLYAAGLRPGEGLRLRGCDVDLRERVLSIWDTKFFKSRLVPIGVGLCRVLESYHAIRRGLPMPEAGHSVFFASRRGHAITLQQLERVFTRLRKHTGIDRPSHARRQPRLHDLRHTFAVHRLIAWYREGADVQACLPLLATYLGHVNVSGTQTYLTMTPELLAEASHRFERYGATDKEQNHED